MKNSNEVQNATNVGNEVLADVMRSASDFKAEVIKKLTAFYAYGDEFGYSNSELSRIRSCITKVEETPV